MNICVNCRHFATRKFKDFPDVCSRLGRIETSPACEHYKVLIMNPLIEQTNVIARCLVSLQQNTDDLNDFPYATGILANILAQGNILTDKANKVLGYPLHPGQAIWVNPNSCATPHCWKKALAVLAERNNLIVYLWNGQNYNVVELPFHKNKIFNEQQIITFRHTHQDGPCPRCD